MSFVEKSKCPKGQSMKNGGPCKGERIDGVILKSKCATCSRYKEYVKDSKKKN